MTTRKNLWVELTLRFVLTITIPFLLLTVSVRIVMTHAFLHLEYNRAGFPPDPYGFTTDDRLRYAPYALDYLLNREDVTYLESLSFPDGRPLFTPRELKHMIDVQHLTTLVFKAAFAAAVLVGLLSLGLGLTGRKAVLHRAYRDAGLLTLGLILLAVIFAMTSWNIFFTGFHSMFFAEGTWYFAYSDTLIRLFPEQFWFDAVIAVGLLTGLGALGLIFVTWWVGCSA